ncbi:MAG: alpha/beta hydrolase [Kangiellaceae bacterium]|nr:alpha/beta hydrolase [Kangiellaceae bacterium]
MRKKLYLIPGTMCNEKLWTELLPYLNSSLELVYLDIPTGKNFNELAEYYNDLLGSDKINLVGFSLGGYIATFFSMVYPERIEKLFVISNSPTSLSTYELNQRSDILKLVETHGYDGLSRKKTADLLDAKNQTSRFIDIILEMGRDLGENEFISQYQYTSERSDLSQAINRFPLHTQFYYSEHDQLVNSSWFSGLTGSKPKLSVFRTSGSGHMLPLEKP